MIIYTRITTYTHVWNKYRPAILKLMLAAADSPQKYTLSGHEFRRLNPKEKGGYTFALQIFRGKAVNSIKMSAVAQDLLSILQQSRTASELTEISTYKFILDKNFVFHVIRSENTPGQAGQTNNK